MVTLALGLLFVIHLTEQLKLFLNSALIAASSTYITDSTKSLTWICKFLSVISWLVFSTLLFFIYCYANIESWCKRLLLTRLIILTSFAPNDTRTARDWLKSGVPSSSYPANMSFRRRWWELSWNEPGRKIQNINYVWIDKLLKSKCTFV